MNGFITYVLDIVVAAALLALALSVYVDGIGYLVFHVVALAGVGAYVFSIASGLHGVPPMLAAGIAIVAGAVAGLTSAEILRPLRDDNLTLASFGLGVCAFEMFRFSETTGGVFGMASIPSLFGENEVIVAVTLLAMGIAIVLVWRYSVTGKVAVALRLDEEGAVSIGARLREHQRFTGMFAGVLAAVSGIWIATTTHFIEPRQFQTSSILIALAGVVIARGNTPFGVVAVIASIVVGSQAARFLSESAVLAGPVTEIAVALALASMLAATKYRIGKRPK